MNADVLDRLRADDPAASLPEEDAEQRERLRRAIVASSIDSLGQAPRGHPQRRILVAAAVGGAVILLGGTAVYAATVVLAPPPTPPRDATLTAAQVRAQYRLWTHKLQLPPGVKWRRENLPEGELWGGNTGAMDAIQWAMAAWSREWIAAAEVHDGQRIAAAGTALARLRAAMPAWHEGETENQGGWDSSVFAVFDAVVADAQRGDFEGLRRFADEIGPAPRPETSLHQVIWVSGGLTQTFIESDQVLAQFRAFQSRIALPPGVKWEAPKLADDEQYGSRTGFVDAIMFAWTAWWREWVAADKAGDRGRIAAAEAASAHIGALLPVAPDGPSKEEWTALEDVSVKEYEQLHARARKGDLDGIKEWLALQDWVTRQLSD